MLQRLKPDEPKRVPAECVCPTGAETASRVAGVCCLITSEAMMTQCSPANVLAWVNRIFTVNKAQLPQVMGVTQRMGARVVLEIGLPMVMHRRPGERAQNARVLHCLVATLGMDLIRGQAVGTGHMQPVQLTRHPQPRLIDVQHLSVA